MNEREKREAKISEYRKLSYAMRNQSDHALPMDVDFLIATILVDILDEIKTLRTEINKPVEITDDKPNKAPIKTK